MRTTRFGSAGLLDATSAAAELAVRRAVDTPSGGDPLQDPRIVIGLLTSAIGAATLLLASGYVLARSENDRRSQLLAIVVGGGFTSVFTGLVIAARGYLAATAFVLVMALLYGALANFYLRL